jgi:ribosomal-protein-alanine N-acetyltransferase
MPVKNEVEVRVASWRDLRPVLRLEKACFREDAWPWVDVLAALTFPGTVRYVAKVREHIIGFVVGDRREHRGVGWVATLGVHPDFRRSGIGTRLLNICETGLATPRVRLNLRPSNVPAFLLYRRQGYVEIDRWKRYYRDGEDGLVMERNFPG